MSIKPKFNHAGKALLALTLCLAAPLFLPAQKKYTPPPAPKAAPKAAPAKTSTSKPAAAPKTAPRSSSSSSARSTSRSSSTSSRSTSRSSSRSTSTSSSQRRQQQQQARQQQQQQKQQQQRQRQQAKQQQQQAKLQQKQQRDAQKQQQQQAKLQQKQQREAQKHQQQQAKNQNSAPMQGQKSATTSSVSSARTVSTSAGHQLSYNSSGHLSAVTTNRGTLASFNTHGQVSTIHTANGTTITHAPGGVRTIQSEHISANGARYQVVSTGAHAGYVQHSYTRGGQTFVTRTYVSPGRTQVAVYQTRFYGGRAYYAYVPGYYYGPRFYGWVYNPWFAPAYFGWGWYDDPWYAPYGYYFSPYAAYPSAAYWLTDYLVSESLRSAFESRAAANSEVSEETIGYQPEAQNTEVVMTPQIKEMIAAEVKAELDAERSEAQNASLGNASAAPQQTASNGPVPAALNPNTRVFIIADSMEVTVDGQSCALSPGDVLNRTEDTPDGANTVAVTVVSSQKPDCRMGSLPRVQVADLQEMHNRFREKMDSGLQSLADNQGKGGIPSGPTADRLANPNGNADAELNARAEIDSQRAEADQAEKEVLDAQASAASSGGTK